MLKLQVIGNIGQQAEIRTTNGGAQAINFSVAHNKNFINRDGVKETQVIWVNCSYFRKDGQSTEVARYLTPGTKVYVEGTPEVRTYQRRDGSTAASLDLIVSFIELTGGGTANAPAPQAAPQAAHQSAQAEPLPVYNDNTETPF
jgi:single-strand DNA-binding protein